MAFDKKTAIVLGASVVAGFLGDVIIYSLAASKGKRFGLHMPKGMQLVNLIAVGVLTGFAIDFSLRYVQSALETPQEKELASLLDTEEQKIQAGAVAGKHPTGVIWT